TYYQRVLDAFPSGRYAYNAEWRIAWVAYLQNQPYADEKMTNFLRKYPTTGGSVNVLYWLGRNAERNGNPARARAYYQKALDRYPNTYFAHAAELRLAKLGPGDPDPVDTLAQIPAAPALRAFDELISPVVADRWNRAQALRSIAFAASSALQLKAAHPTPPSTLFISSTRHSPLAPRPSTPLGGLRAPPLRPFLMPASPTKPPPVSGKFCSPSHTKPPSAVKRSATSSIPCLPRA